MIDDELAESLALEGGQREAFLSELDMTRRAWAYMKTATPPDNRMLKRRLEQYYSTVEKLLEIARGLPEYLTDIKPDPNAGNETILDAWLQHPPHPIDYLDLILKDRLDLLGTLAAREQDPDAVFMKDMSDLVKKLPRSDAHKRDRLINALVDLFVIAYPNSEPKIYNDPLGGVAGGFAGFMRDVLPAIDPDFDQLETLLERARRRFKNKGS